MAMKEKKKMELGVIGNGGGCWKLEKVSGERHVKGKQLKELKKKKWGNRKEGKKRPRKRIRRKDEEEEEEEEN